MKLLYITFIDFGRSESGSSVRPQKMYEAFQSLGCVIRLISGRPKEKQARLGQIRQLRADLATEHFDICYVEPPTGPLFLKEDRDLIRRIHEKGIPVALFYRDMFWQFKLLRNSGNPVARLKEQLIIWMQERDWKLFSSCVNILYFPTEELSRKLPTAAAVDVLPPGTFLAVSSPKTEVGKPPVGLYVGGVNALYGTKKLLDATAAVNRGQTRFKLKLVCRRAEWDAFAAIHGAREADWLEVLHISGDKQLETVYAEADFVLCPQSTDPYNDVAMPIKLMEYISYLKPVVATDFKPMKRVIDEYEIGLTCPDTVDGLASAIIRMLEDDGLRLRSAENCLRAREANLWQIRAQKVLTDLTSLRKS